MKNEKLEKYFNETIAPALENVTVPLPGNEVKARGIANTLTNDKDSIVSVFIGKDTIMTVSISYEPTGMVGALNDSNVNLDIQVNNDVHKVTLRNYEVSSDKTMNNVITNILTTFINESEVQ